MAQPVLERIYLCLVCSNNVDAMNLQHLQTPKDSVYGKRDGVLHGLAIVHKDDRNLMRQTVGFKTGAILNVKMCPRSEMYKPALDSWAGSTLCLSRVIHQN